MGFPDGLGGANSLEELFQDNVKPGGFSFRRFQQFFKVVPVFRRQFFRLPGKELEVQADGVERIAYFMGYAGRQQGQRIEPLRLDVLRIALLLGRFVADEDQVALAFIADGGK
ncbi:hypothetical protein V3C20_07340 [Akkermansia sp. RCC_12PD]|uniref:hypothetical protein n=1 Tax=Akkermansia sp. RCC_12PD TaxID=3115152 RepID=UPI002EDAE690